MGVGRVPEDSIKALHKREKVKRNEIMMGRTMVVPRGKASHDKKKETCQGDTFLKI